MSVFCTFICTYQPKAYAKALKIRECDSVGVVFLSSFFSFWLLGRKKNISFWKRGKKSHSSMNLAGHLVCWILIRIKTATEAFITGKEKNQNRLKKTDFAVRCWWWNPLVLFHGMEICSSMWQNLQRFEKQSKESSFCVSSVDAAWYRLHT